MLFKLLRIKHWTKNILIFLPIFLSFTENIGLNSLIAIIIGFFAFSFTASAIYIINDIFDIDTDKKHPVKKHRPIASGYYSIRLATIISAVLIVLSFVFIWIITIIHFKTIHENIEIKYFLSMFIILFTYLITNILYSLYLKHIPIVDIFILSLGFILRIYFGSAIISVDISHWFYLTIMASSFYLGLGKRRNEVSLENNDNVTVRHVLKYYTYEFLDKHMYMMLTMSLIFYSLWCIDPATLVKYEMGGGTNLTITIPFLLLIVMKYNLNIEKKDSSADPTDIILNDKLLLGLILIYFIVLFISLYKNLIVRILNEYLRF